MNARYLLAILLGLGLFLQGVPALAKVKDLGRVKAFEVERTIKPGLINNRNCVYTESTDTRLLPYPMPQPFPEGEEDHPPIPPAPPEERLRVELVCSFKHPKLRAGTYVQLGGFGDVAVPRSEDSDSHDLDNPNDARVGCGYIRNWPRTAHESKLRTDLVLKGSEIETTGLKQRLMKCLRDYAKNKVLKESYTVHTHKNIKIKK